ncbi:MAG: TRZ/ATZ family hydrolase [Pseudomonadota bacterium]
MRPITSLLSSRYIVPVEPIDCVLEDHSIAIDNGRIVDILPTTEAHQQFSAKTYHEYDQHILMPGLINAHTHAAMTLFRGFAADLPVIDWLENHIWPAEAKWVDEIFVRDGTELAIAEMLRGGTTCFNDMYFYPETTARVASSIGMRAVVGMIIMTFPTRYASTAEEYFSKSLALFDEYKSDPLIRCIFAPHAPYSVPDHIFTKINSYANELDLQVHIHVHESQSEIDISLKEHGVRPLARLQNLGLVNPNLLAVHMTQLNDEEIALIADSGANIVTCPQSNMKLSNGFCPTQKLLDHGIRLAIGTDGCASNDDLDMFSEMQSASLLAKGISGEPTAFSAQQAIQAVTIDAARALGLADEIGSLQKDKSADIIAIRCDTVESLPIYDIYSHLVYSTSRERVCDAFVAGRQLLRDRALTSVSEDEIITKAQHWAKKISQ